MPQSSRKDRSVQTVIIDKSALFRAGLMHILAGPRFRVAASCAALDDLPSNVWNSHECLALIGLDDEAGGILSQVSSLKLQYEGLRAVMLSDRFDPEELFAAIEAGGDGYLLKNEISPDALLKALDLVLLGEAVIPQGFAGMVRGRGRRRLQLEDLTAEPCPEPVPEAAAEPEAIEFPAPLTHAWRLSTREQMILRHLTAGASNKHIARELNISEATVKVHVKSVLRKIHARNRTQAAMWAVNHPAACG